MIRKMPVCWLVFLLLVSACSALPETSPTLLPTSTPSAPTPIEPAPEVYRVIRVSLRVIGAVQSAPELESGTRAVLQAGFEPELLTLSRSAAGGIASAGMQPWEGAFIRQMRVCFQLAGEVCDPAAWQPFQTALMREIQVDWLGPRELNLFAEFQGEDGANIPAVVSYIDEPQTAVQKTLTLTGILLPGTALGGLPAPVQTSAAATRTAAPVSGSVVIEGGRCCAGGAAGTRKQLQVDFKAASTAGAVTEMKVQAGAGCVKDAAQLTGSWEPFQSSRTYETTLALNWVGWWVSVQYRDARGNVSPVFCDDISLEGSPPAPKP
jgi:hypothetical protein